MFQFTDDLTSINDGGEFEEVHHEIYPHELELNYETAQIMRHPFWILTLNL